MYISFNVSCFQKQFDPVFVPCNPPEDVFPVKTKIVIPTENLNLTNGHSVKSYNLLVLVGIVAKNGFVKDVDLSKRMIHVTNAPESVIF